MTNSGSTFTVALWASNIAVPVNGIDAWAANVDAQMAAAANDGARLLVMPEYAAEQWLSFAPGGLSASEEIPWMAEQAPAALEALRPLPARHGIALLAGTMPVARENGGDAEPPHINRAHLLLPDGRVFSQDKLCLTPSEMNPRGWNLGTGKRVTIVEWEGLRVATLVCLDIELPGLAARLAPFKPDLVLVPSMTETGAGYHRVFGCARARATELYTVVCAVGVIGAAATGKPRAGYRSGAAAYVPSDNALGTTGVWAELPLRSGVDGPGPVLLAEDLP
ncbi:MAG: nitrilase-related carbon-nitrogen hydrolase, partial [Gammaproteobacteria bacterium]|nr:nitrilase-related carbon-nitrogen hydrolase [Gammaproteobacteria bacterium]